MLLFFLFKQKTAYEMRISDWSSDVCSSDLLYTFHGLKGYVLTSRIVFGHYTGQVSKRLRSGGAFKLFAEELSLPPGGTMKVLQAQPFTSGDARTQGYFGDRKRTRLNSSH